MKIKSLVIETGSELATILAALRLFQEHFKDVDDDTIAEKFPEHFTRDDGTLLQPLDTDDIDFLCEQINASGASEEKPEAEDLKDGIVSNDFEDDMREFGL